MYDSTLEDAEDSRLLAVRTGLLQQQRVIAAAEAESRRLLAEADAIASARGERLPAWGSKAREMPRRSIALELAAALRLADITVQRQMGDAGRLVEHYPATVDALSSGMITARHADGIVREGLELNDPEVRRSYEAAVLEHAVTATPTQTQRFAERTAELLHPKSFSERFQCEKQKRCVMVQDLGTGLSQLTYVGESVLVHGMFDRLTRQANAIRDADRADRRERANAQETRERRLLDDGRPDLDEQRPDVDERSLDQMRADLLADLVLTGTPAVDASGQRRPNGLGAIQAHVQITVPVTTLTGVTDKGGELDGRAPVDAETARRLAGAAPGWDRVMTDPVTGTVLEVDRYTPSAAQKRFLDARDVLCRGPGCRRPVRYAQIDHNHEYHDGGPTAISNLCPFCVRHHTLKSETAWAVTQLPGGRLEFTSPLGFIYATDPPSRVVFLPADDNGA